MDNISHHKKIQNVYHPRHGVSSWITFPTTRIFKTNITLDTGQIWRKILILGHKVLHVIMQVVGTSYKDEVELETRRGRAMNEEN